MSAVLEAREAERQYRGPSGKPVQAVRGVSLSIKEGECRGIVGESGCGKSTLIRMLAGLEPPSAGEVRYLGRPLKEQMRSRRNEIQMIFQNSMDAVNQYAAAEEIIGEPLRNFRGWRRGRCREEAERLLAQVGLSKEALGKYPAQFSGGQLQRVCIARALAAEPRVLLLDEPLSSLDVSVQAQIMELLGRLGRERGLTQVLVSHDLEAVYCLSDSISVMYGGYIMEEIGRMDLFPRLCHPYTKRLLAACGWGRENGKTEALREGRGSGEGCPYAAWCPKCKAQCRMALPELLEAEEGHWVRCWAV